MVAKPREDDNGTDTTRTTLNLGNVALQLVRRRAEVTGQTMGEAATELILEAETRVDHTDKESLPSYVIPSDDGIEDEPEPVPGQYYKGILLVPKRGDRRPVTMELVRELMDEFP